MMNQAPVSTVDCNRSIDQNGTIDYDWQYDAYSENQLIMTFNFWSLGVVMPIIALFGVLANLASVVVLTSKSMRSSPINIYLAGLSTFDGLLLLMTLLLYPAMCYCEMDQSDAGSPWCQYFFRSALLTYPVSLIMQSGSVWTLTAITIDRFIVVTWPLRSREWCTSRRAYCVMNFISVWSVLYNLPSFFELKLINLTIPNDQANSNITDIDPIDQVVLTRTDLRNDLDYIIAYKGYCYMIFMLLIPAGTMVVLNIFVTVSVRKAYRLRKAMSGRDEKERRCTIMAILVASTFLVFNSLAFVNNIFEIFSSVSPSEPPQQSISSDDNFTIDHYHNETTIEQSGQNAPKSVAYLLLVTVGNVLVALNSATNFFIYCAFGLRFRRTFCKLFCSKICGISTLSTDTAYNDKSYHSLSVRYGAHSTPNYKRNSDTDNGQINSASLSPMPPNQRRSFTAEYQMDPLHTHGSNYSLCPQAGRSARHSGCVL